MELYLDKAQQFATFEQSKELIALGVKHTNPFYYVHNNGGIVTYSNWKVDFNTCTVAFTLADIMALLPQKIDYEDYTYELTIDVYCGDYYMSYKNGNVEIYGDSTDGNKCLTHAAAQLLISILKDKDISFPLKDKAKAKVNPPALDLLILQSMPQHSILNIVVRLGGKLVLPKNTFGISIVKAVTFTEQFDEKTTDWNDYVANVREAIGVKTYCEWVRNSENSMVGIIALYDLEGNKIKTKHFDKWWALLEIIRNTDLSYQLSN